MAAALVSMSENPIHITELAQFVTSARSTWAYTENDTDAELNETTSIFTTTSRQAPGDYQYGRVFGPDCNLIWQSVGNNLFQVMWLALEPVDPKVHVFGSPIRCDTSEEGRLLLWGTLRDQVDSSGFGGSVQQEQMWIESRIPRLLRYPVSEAPRRVALAYRSILLDLDVVATFWARLIGYADNE